MASQTGGSAVRNQLYDFLKEECGVHKFEDLATKEKEIISLVEDHFQANSDEPFEACMANSLIFSMCSWPPLVDRINSGNTLMDIIPDEVVDEFLPLLYTFLESMFPGKYCFVDNEIRLVKP